MPYSSSSSCGSSDTWRMTWTARFRVRQLRVAVFVDRTKRVCSLRTSVCFSVNRVVWNKIIFSDLIWFSHLQHRVITSYCSYRKYVGWVHHRLAANFVWSMSAKVMIENWLTANDSIAIIRNTFCGTRCLSHCHILLVDSLYAQYTPPTPTRRNCFVASASVSAVWTRIRN